MDRVRSLAARTHFTSMVLGLAMLVSAALTIWLGRDMTFSGDEVVWVAATPGIDPATVFEPHGGHLLALTRLVYWPFLEIFGLAYLPFQLLALGAIFTAVALLFRFGRERVGGWLALGPCLVLLFFGSDFLHLFQGNGFTVLIAMAFGLAALLSLERNDLRGDLLACLWLCLGVLSYSVILPFVAGVLVAVLLRPHRLRRIWVPLVPAALYLGWRAWLLIADVEGEGGGFAFENLAKLPSWTFQSLSGITNSLTGLSYSFGGMNIEGQVELAGPPLALLAIFGIGLSVARRGFSRELVVALTILLTLFAIQVAASGSLRLPGSETRYLYPGAIAFLLVVFTAARDIRPTPLASWLVALACLSGFCTNVILMKDNAPVVRTSGEQLRTFAAGADLVVEVREPGDVEPSRTQQLISDNSLFALLGMANQGYGSFGYEPGKVLTQPDVLRAGVDGLLGTLLPVSVVPGDPPARCGRTVTAGPTGQVEFESGPGVVYMRSLTGGEVSVGRFAETAGFSAGRLDAGEWSALEFPEDSAGQRWKVAFAGPELEICVR